MSAPTVWQYRVTNDKGRWLADVVLRSDGFFATVSDWGNYAFRWTHPGMPFRAFVAQLEGQVGYVCSKLARADWWDGEKTLKRIREHITTARREGDMTKEEAAKEWQVLADALGCWGSREARDRDDIDRGEFHTWYLNTDIADAHEFARYDYQPDVRAFCAEVMPRLAALLRAELTADGQATGEVAP